MKAVILYVEDDVTLSFVTRDNLQMSGYEVDFCGDGLTALEMIGTRNYDLCILDVMLPRLDGFSVARKIREQNPQIPILFLTARSSREDRITGLRLGGDDYLTKPFSIEELVLKIEIFLRRSRIVFPEPVQSQVGLGRFVFDAGNQQLSDGEIVIPLTHRESELLKFLSERMNQVVRREEILQAVWGNDHFFASRSLDVFISRLRKIVKSDERIQIENIHNTGYRIRVKND